MKIGIVGTGMVGATAAYALVMRGIGREIVLIDKNVARARAEADDILHAVPFANPVRIDAGDFPDLTGARLVIIAAGISQVKGGETRMQLLGRNAAVFRELIPQILHYAPDAVLVVATNPVDVMTHLAARFAAEQGFPAGRVLGSGTTLDTARFRSLLSVHLHIDAPHIHGYVVGEHGDSEVLTWSLVTVGGIPLDEFCRLNDTSLTDKVRQDIDERVRRAAYRIIEGKGSTYYGVGSALARIAEVVLGNQRAILTVCAPAPDVAGVADVTVSLPRLLSGEGVIDTFPLPLVEQEQALLHKSASVVRSAIEELQV